jgi:hypothetical protein
MATKQPKQDSIEVLPIETGTVRVCLVGLEPLICNRVSEKARRELLAPRGRLTSAEKKVTQKHNPLEEFRASVYRLPEPAPALIGQPSTAFKGAMGTAALDLPGTKKAQIGRLTWVKGTYIPIFGTPQLLMSVVRSADINRTPDIRTRAILPRWACALEVTFVKPLIQEQAVANLLGAAGLIAGVGDWRSEKGKGSFGQYDIVNEDDPTFLALCHEGRAVQAAALEHPVCFDDETQSLFDWFTEEMDRRRKQGRVAKSKAVASVAEAVQ